MLLGNRSLRVYACAMPVDMRKGHNGLAALVATFFKKDVLQGSLFLFLSRTRKSAKVLMWDGTGLVVIHKRLERGRFANIFSKSLVLTLTTSELSLLFEGSRVRLPLSCREFHLGDS